MKPSYRIRFDRVRRRCYENCYLNTRLSTPDSNRISFFKFMGITPLLESPRMMSTCLLHPIRDERDMFRRYPRLTGEQEC